MDDGIEATATRDQRTEAERRWMTHIHLFGSAGYPVRKLKAGCWVFDAAFGAGGTPTVYRTRRAAMAAAEAFELCLIEKASGRWT